MPFYRGTSQDDLLVGSAFDDVIGGYDGNDLIDDGGSGADELVGGRGNDGYFVRDARGSVIELAGEGYDTVNTTLDRYTLAANVERLVYAGVGSFVGLGNALDNDISGGTGNDSLAGGDGNDLLRGGAGNDLLDGQAGLDTMIGGTGDDFYYIDSTGDSVIENANEGTDRAIVGGTVDIYTMSANIEQLQNRGSQLFYGYGNALANLIIGGTGQDWLFGYDGADIMAGGAGDDRLYGGTGAANTLIGSTGNDYYFIDVQGDTIVEYAGEGTDRVLTTLNQCILPANVEELYFRGTGSFSGTGNTSTIAIVGGAGDDYLTYAANLYGGRGNDIYYVYGGENIVENPNEGTDTIVALDTRGAFIMGANVENFVSRAYFSVNVTGNNLDNVIVGTAAQTFMVLRNDVVIPNPGNVLSGGAGNDTILAGAADDVLEGGSGSDILTGGAGFDKFRYTGTETGGYDRITDFSGDAFWLSASGFTRTATFDFVGNRAPAPTSSNSTFLYDTSTGLVSYDADGTGAGAAVMLAQLDPGLALQIGNFLFY